MIVHQVIRLIAQPTFRGSILIDEQRQSLRTITHITRLKARWKQLYNIFTALPEMQIHMRDTLDTYTNGNWYHLLVARLQSEMLYYDSDSSATTEDYCPRSIVRREYVNYAALWRLMNLDPVRRKRFWEEFDRLVVDRRQPLVIVHRFGEQI